MHQCNFSAKISFKPKGYSTNHRKNSNLSEILDRNELVIEALCGSVCVRKYRTGRFSHGSLLTRIFIVRSHLPMFYDKESVITYSDISHVWFSRKNDTLFKHSDTSKFFNLSGPAFQ